MHTHTQRSPRVWYDHIPGVGKGGNFLPPKMAIKLIDNFPVFRKVTLGAASSVILYVWCLICITRIIRGGPEKMEQHTSHNMWKL